MAINLEREGVALNAEERNKRNNNLTKIEQGFNGLEQSVGGSIEGMNSKINSVESSVNAKVDGVVSTSQEAKSLATTAVQTAETAEGKVDNVQTQLNTLVVEGDSSPQATQASVGADGTEYGGNLKARLDAEHNKVNQRLAETPGEKETTQRNFLELKKRHMYTQGNNEFEITGLKNISFYFPLSKTEKAKVRFQRDVNDDFIKMREMSIIGQKSTETTLAKEGVDSIEPSSGMTTPTSTGNSYTPAVGVKLTKTFAGTQIFFNHYADNRGGVWSFTVDGEEVAVISTHIDAVNPSELVDSSTATYRRKIVDNLEDTTHTLVMEFIGDDTENPPIGGTSRGWLKMQSEPPLAGQTFSSFEFNKRIIVPDVIDVLNNQSNKEFAIRIKKTGTDDTMHWFPEHNGVGTVYVGENGSQRLIVDGEEISLFQTTPITTFKEAQLIQMMEITHPQQSEVMGKLYFIATITREKVSMITTVEWLQDITVQKGYVNMLPGDSRFGEHFVTSLGKTIVSPYADNSMTDFGEGDKSHGYAFVSMKPEYKDYMVAIQVPTAYESLRKYDDSRKYNVKTNGAIWLHRRTGDNLLKVYPQVYDLDHEVETGDKYTFEGEYIIAKIPNISEILVSQ